MNKQKNEKGNLFDAYMEKRFEDMAWAEAQSREEDRQAITVRLPVSRVVQIDFLAKNLDHSRQSFLVDLIGVAIDQALDSFVQAHAEGEYRDKAAAEVRELYSASNLAESEARWGKPKESK